MTIIVITMAIIVITTALYVISIMIMIVITNETRNANYDCNFIITTKLLHMVYVVYCNCALTCALTCALCSAQVSVQLLLQTV